MYTIPPKKMVIINILNILKKYTDPDHRLTQAEIMEKLKKEYYMDVDRKTVKRNLADLRDLDCGVDCEEISRNDENGNETTICTDWYIQPEFDNAELRLLIDSLLFSKNIPRTQCRELIEKLKGLSNIYFNKKVSHICNLPENRPENKELFYTIDVLDDAISKNKKVAFVYNEYGADKKLHPRRDREYIVNPYQMVATNGRYYLICNYDKYDGLSNYRIDHITNIRILDEKRKPKKDLSEEMNLPKHMAEHIYMFAGDSVRARFKAKECIVGQIIDWFGNDVKFTRLSGEEYLVEVTVNENAFFFWAIQYGEYVEVLEPQGTREKIANTAKLIAEKHS